MSSCSVSALSESSPQPSPGRLPGHREWRDQSSAGSHSALSPGQAMFGSLVISPWRCCHTGAPGGAGQCNIWPGLASGHQRERERPGSDYRARGRCFMSGASELILSRLDREQRQLSLALAATSILEIDKCTHNVACDLKLR